MKPTSAAGHGIIGAKGVPEPAAVAADRILAATGEERPSKTRRDFARMKRALRSAERRRRDGGEIGGTGATILKFQGAPLTRLADKQRIGSEEIRAADEIALAFQAQAGALMIRPPSLEKRDATYNGHEPAYVIDAISRYKRWARHWSACVRHGDRTLEIVIAAVIDERAFHAIERDAGIRHGVAAKVTIAALRDYAARAGWTDTTTGAAWIMAAGKAYPTRRGGLG